MSKTDGQKRTYFKPSLQRLGDVSGLTASGSVVGKENTGNMANEMG